MTTSRVFKWAGLAILMLLIVTIGAVAVIVHTDKFQRFVLTEVIRKTEATIGGRLTIGGMDVNWRHLEFDFYKIELHGNEGNVLPLFAANHLRIGLKIVSLLRRQVDLNDIVLDQPVAHLTVDASGNSNMPQAPSRHESGSASNESILNDIFDLA